MVLSALHFQTNTATFLVLTFGIYKEVCVFVCVCVCVCVWMYIYLHSFTTLVACNWCSAFFVGIYTRAVNFFHFYIKLILRWLLEKRLKVGAVY